MGFKLRSGYGRSRDRAGSRGPAVAPPYQPPDTTSDIPFATSESSDPYKRIPKAGLLAEIQFKGAISDFYLAKKHIELYPGEEMLVGLDVGEVYGENFFLCINVDEMERRISVTD